jgi:enoyl-CoA hydratase/carnithine racemase
MNVVEVTGDTVSKLSKLVKQAGEQQRAIVLELSKELGQHNVLIEKAIEKEARLLQKA